jgi:L-cysteine desulfidase
MEQMKQIDIKKIVIFAKTVRSDVIYFIHNKYNCNENLKKQ